MGQRFSKQFYPDLLEPRGSHSELRRRPLQREQHWFPHNDRKVDSAGIESYIRDERRSPRKHRSNICIDTLSSRFLRDGTKDTNAVSHEAKSSASKPASNHTSRRLHQDHDHKPHHRNRTHDGRRRDSEISSRPQDGAYYVLDPPPYDSRAHNSNRTSTQQCPICASTRSMTHFPTRSPTSACTHEALVCRRCLRRWLEAQFETKAWNELNCPQCPSILEYRDIREFASKNMFRR